MPAWQTSVVRPAVDEGLRTRSLQLFRMDCYTTEWFIMDCMEAAWMAPETLQSLIFSQITYAHYIPSSPPCTKSQLAAHYRGLFQNQDCLSYWFSPFTNLYTVFSYVFQPCRWSAKLPKLFFYFCSHLSSGVAIDFTFLINSWFILRFFGYDVYMMNRVMTRL